MPGEKLIVYGSCCKIRPALPGNCLMKSAAAIFLLPFLMLVPAYGQTGISKEDITVLDEPADHMMRDYLTALVDRQFAARNSYLSTLRTAEDWDRWAQTIRDSMRSWTGPFPERTPLNPRVTGRFGREGYVVEKILFESRPGIYVSASMYLPEGVSFPRPAVLNVIGHSPTGKARDKVQQRSIVQAKRGFVVLTIDCLGQGERTDPDYHHLGHSPGITHGIIGIKAFLAGTHVFNFMVWDAIRAVDYLVSRPEVDRGKICITGCSGGGMMSTYIQPFEERIAVSVPVCNPCTWSHRVHAGLATDHEQVFFGAFPAGIDPRGDPLFCQVPKPLQINATSRDNLNPAMGTWELSTWLYKAYSAHGVPEQFTTTMVDAPHGYNLEQREFAYSWMLRWTGGDASDFWEGDIPIEKDEVLWSASGGNVHNEPGSRRPVDWVMDYREGHRPVWGTVKNRDGLDRHVSAMQKLIREVLNINMDNIRTEGNFIGSRRLDGITVRSFVVEPEEGIVLPGILIEPEQKSSSGDVVLYVSEKGKSGILDNMETVRKITGRGTSICAVDLRGIGETALDESGKFRDFLAGRPIFGQRVYDVLAVTRWLKGTETGAGSIMFLGKGMGCLYGAFAGVFDDGITGFVLEEPLLSFESVIRVTVPEYGNAVLLPGILQGPGRKKGMEHTESRRWGPVKDPAGFAGGALSRANRSGSGPNHEHEPKNMSGTKT